MRDPLCLLAVALVALVASVRDPGSSRHAAARLMPPLGAGLSKDVLRHVLSLVPRRAAFAATGEEIDGLSFWEGGDRPDRVFRGCANALGAVKFLPWGRRVVAAGANGVARICCAISGQILRTLFGGHLFGSTIYEVQAFPDGRRVASIASDRRVVIWSVESGDVLQTLRLDAYGEHRVLRLVAGGGVLTGVTLVGDAPAVVWCPASGAAMRELRHPMRHPRMHHLEVSACGRKAITADHGAAFVWDLASGRPGRRLLVPQGNFGSMRQVALSAERGRVLAAASVGPRLYIWEDADGLPTKDIGGGLERCMFSLLGEGEVVVAVSSFDARAWDTSSGRLLWRAPGSRAHMDIGAQRIAASAGGELIAACGAQERFGARWVALYNASSRRLVHSTVSFGGACSVAVSYDGGVVGALAD